MVDPAKIIETKGIPLWNTPTAPKLVSIPSLLEQPTQTQVYLNEDDDLLQITENNPSTSSSDYIVRMVKNLDSVYKDVKERVEKEQNRLRDASRESDVSSHKFEVGDQAWLAVPLRAESQRVGVPEKMLYRWTGPVRILRAPALDNTSQSQYTVLETYPGKEIVLRTVHVGRLRPFTIRIPVDSAEDVMELQSRGTDYLDKELKDWEKRVILKSRPRGKQQTVDGRSVEWLKRFSPDFTDEDITNPLYEIQEVKEVRLYGRRYQYKVKWVGYSNRHNSWQDEWDMPTELVNQFWNDYKKKAIDHKSKKFLAARESFLLRHKDNSFRRAPINTASPGKRNTSERRQVNAMEVLPDEPESDRNGAKWILKHVGPRTWTREVCLAHYDTW